MSEAQLYLGDNRTILPTFAENSISSVVTDPPYGLSKDPDVEEVLTHWLAGDDYEHSGTGFMGKSWDAFVPGPATWREMYRVMKPGAYACVFAGSRTVDLMGIALRVAGFIMHPMLGWIQGCLSDDTEILVDGKWEHYSKAIAGKHTLCYNIEDDTFKWMPIEERFEYDYQDTAFRIQSDNTDQIVSRNHRCLVEQDGSYVFRIAEQIGQKAQVRVPILESLPTLLNYLSDNENEGHEKDILFSQLRHEGQEEREATREYEENACNLCGLWQASLEARCLAKESCCSYLLKVVQRKAKGQGICKARPQSTLSLERGSRAIIQGKDVRPKQSWLEGRSNILQETWQLQDNQVCEMPARVCDNGTQRRLCDGTQANGSAGNWQTTEALRDCSSQESRPARQPLRESSIVRKQQRPQVARGARYTRADLVTVTPIHYTGKVWCVRVPTGAFVARRNGKVFVTGNSGFPKATNLSKMLDKQAGAEREVVGILPSSRATKGPLGFHMTQKLDTAPATPAAIQWDGWYYGRQSLKPCLEPILMVQKPPDRRMVDNVLEWGTGAVNVDGCRIGTDTSRGDRYNGKPPKGARNSVCQGKWDEPWQVTPGRFPANVLHDGSAVVTAEFDNQTPERTRQASASGANMQGKSIFGNNDARQYVQYYDTGSAARFFAACPYEEDDFAPFMYCPKASKRDRDEGLDDVQEKRRGSMQGNVDDGDFLTGSGNPRRSMGRNTWPTVKPTSLIRWLCRLITPPGGTVLDCFMGSGTHGKAAILEGFDFVGIEREKEAFDISEKRIEHALQQMRLAL